MGDKGPTFVMVARTSPEDFERFIAFEDRFIELFGAHGLVLRHRFRDVAASTEIHVIEALRVNSLETYFADPRRSEMQTRFATLRMDQQVHVVTEITGRDSCDCA